MWIFCFLSKNLRCLNEQVKRVSNYDGRYLHEYIKSYWNDVFLCEKFRNFTKSTGVKILRKWTVSAGPWVIHPKICGNCPSTENLHTKKSEDIGALYAVEATFAIIYLWLLFRADLNFSIKYVSYDSLKILLSSGIAKNSIFLKFPSPHVLKWLSTSICCNLGCRICCF